MDLRLGRVARKPLDHVHEPARDRRGAVRPLAAARRVRPDAATGAELWRHDPGLPGAAQRGLMWWDGDGGPRLFYTAGRILIALDPATGEPAEAFGDGGRLDLMPPGESGPMTVTAPGVVFEDRLIFGFSTSESDGALPGSIRAFDAGTGELEWQFDSIPQPRRPRGRDLGPRLAGERGGREHVDGDGPRRGAGPAVRPHRVGHARLLRRPTPRRQPLRQLPARPRRPDRRAALALPGRAARHLGPRPARAADPGRARARRDGHRRGRADHEVGPPLRLRPRHRRVALRDHRGGDPAQRAARRGAGPDRAGLGRRGDPPGVRAHHPQPGGDRVRAGDHPGLRSPARGRRRPSTARCSSPATTAAPSGAGRPSTRTPTG